MKLCLVILVFLSEAGAAPPIAVTQTSPAEITIKEWYEPHQPIVAEITARATVYIWDYGDTFEVIEVADGRTVYIWAPPGKHRLRCLLLTIDWEKQTVAKRKVWAEFTVKGNVPPLPPQPPPSDLSAFTANLVEELNLETRSAEVATFFRDAILKIDAGDLRGSKAIVEAVSKRIADMKSVKWQAFSTMLYQHLLNDLKLVTQAQWSNAYKQIVLGLKGAKS